MFERLAYNIASAIARQRVVQTLRESENRLRQEQIRLAETLEEVEQLKDAFTGALADKIGRFQLAHGGTLFLDEIAELDLELQAPLSYEEPGD